MLKVNTCVYVHPYDSFNAKKDIIETNIAIKFSDCTSIYMIWVALKKKEEE